MRTADRLRDSLQRIDGRGYKAYRDLRGAYRLDDSTEAVLFVDHVQGDPFAAPSLLRLRIPMESARLPATLRDSAVRRLALRDRLARAVREALRRSGEGRAGSLGSGKSGLIEIDAGGQEVLERSAVVLDEEWVEARVAVGLPAAGRRVRGRAAEHLLLAVLPRLAQRSLCLAALDAQELERFVASIEAQEWLRNELPRRGLVAFVGDGSVLPRESGVSDRPMPVEQAIPFEAPAALAVEIELPHPVPTRNGAVQRLRGLGIEAGVTLIVGGGYHGKSTLLRAIERAVYPHVPGDGREWVVADRNLAKVRAEDGRAVTGTDIRAFVRELPAGRNARPRPTRAFSTAEASGSTSQAANIIEAIEAGARGLLIDEDTSATNLMVRDARMQALIARDGEPITPFLERVRELHERAGISTVMVMGGVGDYFDVADRVIAMRHYAAFDATAEARRIAREVPGSLSGNHDPDAPERFECPQARVPLRAGFDPSSGRREVKIGAKGLQLVLYGRESIDLRGLEQLVDPSQTRAIAGALHRLAEHWIDGTTDLAKLLDALEDELDRSGLDLLDPFHQAEHHPGEFARPRRLEIAAALSRMRSLQVAAAAQDQAKALPTGERP